MVFGGEPRLMHAPIVGPRGVVVTTLGAGTESQ